MFLGDSSTDTMIFVSTQIDLPKSLEKFANLMPPITGGPRLLGPRLLGSLQHRELFWGNYRVKIFPITGILEKNFNHQDIFRKNPNNGG